MKPDTPDACARKSIRRFPCVKNGQLMKDKKEYIKRNCLCSRKELWWRVVNELGK